MMLLLFSGIRLGLSNLVFNVIFFLSFRPTLPLATRSSSCSIIIVVVIFVFVILLQFGLPTVIIISYVYTCSEYYKTSPQTTDPSTLYKPKRIGRFHWFPLNNRHQCLFFADHIKYSCWGVHCAGISNSVVTENLKNPPRFFIYTFHLRPRFLYDICLIYTYA